jgi:hypothetical protein
MAGMTTQPQLLPRAFVVPAALGAAGGRFRTAGPDLCPTGH